MVVGVEVVEGEEIVEEVETTRTPVLRQQTPKLQVRQPRVPSIKEPNTLTFRLETGRGALCILNGVEVLFSVQSPLPAPGRMSTPPNLKNEMLTSSVYKQFQSIQ